jgi:hypothetical protein
MLKLKNTKNYQPVIQKKLELTTNQINHSAYTQPENAQDANLYLLDLGLTH